MAERGRGGGRAAFQAHHVTPCGVRVRASAEVELSFMQQLLDMDPEQRPTAAQALELPWMMS